MKKQHISANMNYNDITDERLIEVNNRGLAAAGIIAIFYCIGMIIYKGVAKEELAVNELILLLVMVGATYFVELKNHVYDIPKAFGHQLNTAETRSARLSRIKYYLLDSLVFATVLGVLSLLDEKLSIVDSLIEFGGSFVVSFVIDFIWREFMVKRYNKYMKSLEDDFE